MPENPGFSTASVIKQLIIGEIILMRVSKPEANTLNICCDVFVRNCQFVMTFNACIKRQITRTAENIDAVSDLVLSQEGSPGTHKPTSQIARETDISQRSVGRIIHKDIQRKCLKKRF